MPLYVLVVGGIAAAVLLFLLLRLIYRALKGLRWNEAAFGKPSAGTVRTNRLKEALKALFNRIAAALSFELAYLRNRNTAEGLLTYAERSFAGPGKKELRRRTGESDAAFLRRIRSAGVRGEKFESSREPGECFEALASLLERRIYGNAAEEVSAEFCRSFRAALRDVLRNVLKERYRTAEKG